MCENIHNIIKMEKNFINWKSKVEDKFIEFNYLNGYIITLLLLLIVIVLIQIDNYQQGKIYSNLWMISENVPLDGLIALLLLVALCIIINYFYFLFFISDEIKISYKYYFIISYMVIAFNINQNVLFKTESSYNIFFSFLLPIIYTFIIYNIRFKDIQIEKSRMNSLLVLSFVQSFFNFSIQFFIISGVCLLWFYYILPEILKVIFNNICEKNNIFKNVIFFTLQLKLQFIRLENRKILKFFYSVFFFFFLPCIIIYYFKIKALFVIFTILIFFNLILIVDYSYIFILKNIDNLLKIFLGLKEEEFNRYLFILNEIFFTDANFNDFDFADKLIVTKFLSAIRNNLSIWARKTKEDLISMKEKDSDLIKPFEKEIINALIISFSNVEKNANLFSNKQYKQAIEKLITYQCKTEYLKNLILFLSIAEDNLNDLYSIWERQWFIDKLEFYNFLKNKFENSANVFLRTPGTYRIIERFIVWS